MAEESAPEITIVIPCYNAEKWVARAIESALSQPGASVEILVIDDGSTDHSLSVIKGYRDSIRLRTQPNRGGCAARNHGLALASKPFVMFLDADDYLEEPILSRLADSLNKSSAHVALGEVRDESEAGRLLFRPRPDIGDWRKFIIDWLDGTFIPPCGILWSTDFVRNLGGWNERLSKNQDGDLILRAAIAGAKFTSADGGYGIYWHHAGEDRISNALTAAKVHDCLSVYVDLARTLAMQGRLDEELESAFSRATHDLQRAACRDGLFGAEAEIRSYRASMRWPRYEGTISHIIGCNILGLRRKEILTQWLSQIASDGFYVRPHRN